MRLNAPKGQKVKYLAKNGYDSDREKANKFLKKGNKYTVLRTHVGRSSSTVTLKEFPNQRFNTVMFKEVGWKRRAVQTEREIYEGSL